MTVLSGNEILSRLQSGHIFRTGTWLDDCVQEASYDLRGADDFLIVGGIRYPEGKPFPDAYISIGPGEIALLSTIERCNFPANLVGRLGIKFALTRQGLTPLFGFQVNPLYGANVPDERLYLRVFNLGSHPIMIKPGDKVFNIELHSVEGAIPDAVLDNIQRRGSVKGQIEHELFATPAQYPGFMKMVRDEVKSDIQGEIRDLNTRVANVEGGTRTVVLFGVFIVAASILGVALSVLLQTFGRGLTSLGVGTPWDVVALVATLLVAGVLALALLLITLYVLRHLRLPG